MQKRRDILILVVLFVILVVFTLLGPAQTRDESLSHIPTTHSSAPGGALALLQWSDMLGYDAHRLEYRPFELDESADALVMLNPSEPVNLTQTEMVLDWVDDGGTLILADDRSSLFHAPNGLLLELEVMVRGYQGGLIEHAPVVQPMLHAPPLQEVLARTGYILTHERSDIAPMVGLPTESSESEGDEPPQGADEGNEGNGENEEASQAIVVGIQYGHGYIYLSSAIFPFTNEGLRTRQNSALVLNMLRRIPEGGRILFDEWHHGFFTPPSLRSVVLGNPWGQALVYALVVVALFLVLTGRRFGRPVPLREEVALRSTTEYIENMADLYQRGGKRRFILRHYYTAFKRQIARPYGINPGMDDASFVKELARYREVDEPGLLATLAHLRREKISEEELVRTIAKTEEQIATYRTRGG